MVIPFCISTSVDVDATLRSHQCLVVLRFWFGLFVLDFSCSNSWVVVLHCCLNLQITSVQGKAFTNTKGTIYCYLYTSITNNSFYSPLARFSNFSVFKNYQGNVLKYGIPGPDAPNSVSVVVG